MQHAANTVDLHDWAYERSERIRALADSLTADQLREPFVDGVIGTGDAEDLLWLLTEINPVLNELVSNGSFGAAVETVCDRIPADGFHDQSPRYRARAALQELLRRMPSVMEQRERIALEVAQEVAA